MGKRRRSSLPLHTGDNRHSTDNNVNADDEVRDLSGTDSETHNTSRQSLGAFLWSDVSMVLHACLFKYLHYTCGVIAIERSKERRGVILRALEPELMAFWSSETTTLGTTVQEKLSAVFCTHVNALVEQVTTLANSDMTRSQLCCAFLRLLSVFGFSEEGNTEEAALYANTRKKADLHAYSYHERTSNQLNVLPRYEGDRRTEEQHRQPRVGRVVHFPCPHPHPEINTKIQLIEPKKRRPQLDENRIFSHPKKATFSGMEDVLVDEELHYRALVVLGRHLDTFGSIQYVSPFVRFLLWNTLGRDEELFERLSEPPTNSDEALKQRQELEVLRKRVAERRAAFDATRVEARETAVRIGWCAVSAHWRDQVLRVVGEAEDADWYLLRDSAKTGSRAIFPNYAGSGAVKDIALKALRRVRDNHVDCAVEDAPACYEVIVNVLFPLLEGSAPSFPEMKSASDDSNTTSTSNDNTNDNNNNNNGDDGEEYEKLRKRIASLMAVGTESLCSDEDVARGVRWNFDCETFLPLDGLTCSFITDMFVWPLQCLASFLELIAVGRYSVDGLRKFFAAFIFSNWGDEELLLEFLLRREPTNISLASLVGFPRLVRNVYTSAQWLRKDKHFSSVVECHRQAFLLPPGAAANNYTQWRALSTVLDELEYKEDVLALTVQKMSPHAAEEGKLWSVAEMVSLPKAWVEGLALMMTATSATFEKN